MNLFEKIFGSKTPEEKYVKKYGDEGVEIIQNKISSAVELKRNGNFTEANEIYSNLDIQYPNNPVILKSWAKILICLGEYDSAITKYKEASKLYREIGSGEYWQCDDQINTIKNRFEDPQSFKEWVNILSGGNINDATI